MRALYGLLAVPAFALVLLAAPKALPNAADVMVNAGQLTEACPNRLKNFRFNEVITLNFSLSDGWNGTIVADRIEANGGAWDSAQELLTCTYGPRHNREDSPDHPGGTANTYSLVKSFAGRGCTSNGSMIPLLTCAR